MLNALNIFHLGLFIIVRGQRRQDQDCIGWTDTANHITAVLHRIFLFSFSFSIFFNIISAYIETAYHH